MSTYLLSFIQVLVYEIVRWFSKIYFNSFPHDTLFMMTSSLKKVYMYEDRLIKK